MEFRKCAGIFGLLIVAAGVCDGEDTRLPAIARSRGASPLRFEPNLAPSEDGPSFVAKAREYDVLVEKTGVTIRAGKAHRLSSIRMTLSGADRNSPIEAADQLGATSSYLIGNDSTRWRKNVAAFQRVVVRNPWPGVSMTYYGTEGLLEYDIALDPHARVENVRLKFEGVTHIRIARDGACELTTPSGVLRQHKPVAYQASPGGRIPIAVSYYRASHDSIGIHLGTHDPNLPVVVDPVLSYSTYLGPTAALQNPPATSQNVPGDRIAVDSAGNAYVLGTTGTSQFPGSTGAVTGSLHGANDLYIAKLSPDGSTLLWATYLGGNGDEGIGGIAVGSDGNIYVCGNTTSSDFPTSAGALRRTQSATHEIFVAVLNPSGTALLYSTYLGGTNEQYAYAIAVGPNGTAYVAGTTMSPDFPTSSDAYLPAAFYQNAFFAKFNPALSGAASLVYSTLLSSSGNAFAVAIAVDTAGVAYIAGNAGVGIPTTSNAFQSSPRGYGDAFAIKLDPSQAGSAGLLYSTLLGGSSPFDEACCVAVGAGGRILVGGTTGSSDFPVTPGAYQSSVLSGEQPFVAAFDPTLSGNASLAFSTIVGGRFGSCKATGMAADASGNVYLAGQAQDGFPTTPDAFQTTYAGGVNDGFVAKVSAQGNALLYSSYLGGSDQDVINGMALGPGNDLIVTGSTRSANLPLVAPLINHIPAGVYNMAFVARISGSPSNCVYDLSATALSIGPGAAAGSVNVTTTSGCAWSARTNNLWIGITDGAAGSGNGTVSFDAVPNDGPASRTGTLTIGGRTLTITQDPAVCTYSVLPASIVLSSNAGSGYASFGTLAKCPSVPSFPSWITPSPGYPSLGGGPLSFAVSANTSASNRTGSVQVGTAALAVTQAASSCTYTLRPATLYIGTVGGPQSVAIDTQPGCPWSANTLGNAETNWLQIVPAFGSGPSTVSLTVAPNPNWVSRSDVIRVLDQVLTVVQYGFPQLSITKTHTGSFVAGQNGATYTVSVGNAAAGGPTSGTVTVTETVPVGMTLVSMNGPTWNCTVLPNCTTNSVLNGGSSYPAITVTVNVAANAPAQVTNQVSVSGGGSATASAHDFTTILAAGGSPAFQTSSTPGQSGTGGTFTLQYFDANGNADINRVQIVINDYLRGFRSCLAYYTANADVMYLLDDVGSRWMGPIAFGSSGVLTNSQCSLDLGKSTRVRSGNNLTLSLYFTFNPGFTGAKSVFTEALNNSAQTSNWQTVGSYTVAAGTNTPPTLNSVTPNAGSGTNAIFRFQLSDPDGGGDLDRLQVIIQNGFNPANSCYVYYAALSGLVYLAGDNPATFLGPVMLGQSVTLQNSQCSFRVGTSSVTYTGNTMEVDLDIAFKTPFAGAKAIYAETRDRSEAGANNWQTIGTWTAVGLVNLAPAVDSVAPSSGSGSMQTFIVQFSDENGYADIDRVQVLVNSSLNYGTGCLFQYVRGANLIYLLNDAGSSWLGPALVGSTGTLQNSRCSLNVGNATALGAGNSLHLALPLTLQTSSFSGSRSIYGEATDSGGISSNWHSIGSWTVQ